MPPGSARVLIFPLVGVDRTKQGVGVLLFDLSLVFIEFLGEFFIDMPIAVPLDDVGLRREGLVGVNLDEVGSHIVHMDTDNTIHEIVVEVVREPAGLDVEKQTGQSHFFEVVERVDVRKHGYIVRLELVGLLGVGLGVVVTIDHHSRVSFRGLSRVFVFLSTLYHSLTGMSTLFSKIFENFFEANVNKHRHVSAVKKFF